MKSSVFFKQYNIPPYLLDVYYFNGPFLLVFLVWFGLAGFYGISIIVGYLMPDLYKYILDICGLVGFYGISTLVGYLMPNPLYTYMLNIYDLIWLGLMAYQPL